MPKKVLRIYKGGDPSVNFQFQKHLFQNDAEHVNPFGETPHEDKSLSQEHILAQSIDKEEHNSQASLLNNTSSLSPKNVNEVRGAISQIATVENTANISLQPPQS
jgi:hypothetical protein